MLNKDRKDLPLSVNDFIILAAALCMKRVAAANAAWGDAGSIRQYHYCDVNVNAIDANGKVKAPVIRGLQGLGLKEIAAQTSSISRSTQSQKSDLDEAPGTFSIINVGAYGVKSIAPIVRPGQSVALGVGALRQVVVPQSQGGAKISTIATVTLSCDHRVVDGAIGATWLQNFESLIKNPMTMLL